MSNTIVSNETVLAELVSFSKNNSSFLTLNTISSLAASKTCGLAILVDKLLTNRRINSPTKHLISSLINRFHRHSIEVTVSSDEDPENYIFQTIEKAVGYTFSDNLKKTSVDTAAKLFIRAIIEFESKRIDFETLEHNWKEYMFHFYRAQLYD